MNISPNILSHRGSHYQIEEQKLCFYCLLYICYRPNNSKTSMFNDESGICLFGWENFVTTLMWIIYHRGPRGGGMSIAVKPLMHWAACPSPTFRIYWIIIMMNQFSENKKENSRIYQWNCMWIAWQNRVLNLLCIFTSYIPIEYLFAKEKKILMYKNL